MRLNEVISIGRQYSEPLQDNDSIRVYHGVREIPTAYAMLKRGTSGGKKVSRAYSYENNNNPKGLFVTPDLSTAKEFGHVVIEFHTRVHNLEAPVWPGGSFTVQGQMAQMFNTEDEREQERLRRRMDLSQSEFDYIRDSDRPELAALLLMGGERQALFTGDLNPNSIRAVWVTPNQDKTSSIMKFERMRPEAFIEMYDNGSFGYTDDVPRDIKMIPLSPRDDVDADEFIEKFQSHSKITSDKSRIINVLLNNPDYVYDRTWNDRQAEKILNDLEDKYG